LDHITVQHDIERENRHAVFEDVEGLRLVKVG
jgi:hypothetical protein